MASLDIVVYPRDLGSAELALSRLGWEISERYGTPPEDYGVIFRIPADSVQLELVAHDTARSLAATSGADTVAGLRLHVPDAAAAWQAARAAGLRIDPACESGPSNESWGRLTRAYTAGGLRIDFYERHDA